MSFADGAWPYLHEGEFTVELPPEAKYVAIRFGSQVTNKRLVP